MLIYLAYKNNNNILIKIKKIIYIYCFIFFLFIIKIKNIIEKKININNSLYKKIFKLNIKKNVKVCICTLGKKENNYIREFVEYYKKLKVDKIFLYDNNELNGENFNTILYDYININFVEIINYRGKISPQLNIFNDCYKKNNRAYDWLIFYDIDEFIHLKNYSNIKYFLNEKKFKKCNLIYLNCIRHTDNDLLYYDNRTLKDRFPKINWKSKMYTVKSIIRGNLKGFKFKTTHWLNRNLIGCNFLGKIIKPSKKTKIEKDFNKSFYKLYYIDHYSFKSTEEYINKIIKGDGIYGFNKKNQYRKIKLYFKYNKITKEKIYLIENKTGLNLTKYKLELNKKY